MKTKYLDLAQRLADLFAEQAHVEAVALAGSLGGEQIDAASDIDLYVYTRADISLTARQQIMEQAGGASRASMGLNFWGPGDEWFDAHTGIEVDIVYPAGPNTKLITVRPTHLGFIFVDVDLTIYSDNLSLG